MPRIAPRPASGLRHCASDQFCGFTVRVVLTLLSPVRFIARAMSSTGISSGVCPHGAENPTSVTGGVAERLPRPQIPYMKGQFDVVVCFHDRRIERT